MKPAPAFSDAEARERIRTSLDESLIVEASAGTGKTTELVKRLVEVLASGRTSIEHIAAVTFTHKAAGEMKLRLREALDQARLGAEGQRKLKLEKALEHLEEASIGTIHSFCAQILRERPVEAGVDPGFAELTEPEAYRVYQRAFRSWLEKKLNEDAPGLRRAFARLAWRDGWDDSPALEQLERTGWKLVEWRDYPAPWRRDPFAREAEIDTLARMTRDLAEMSRNPRRVTDELYLGIAPARALAGWMVRAEQAGKRDYDGLEGRLLKLGRELRKSGKKGRGDYGGGVVREELAAQRAELALWIDEFRVRANADLAALLREEMQGLLEEYGERKRRIGKLDFVDLLCLTRDLLKDQAPVRQYLQRRFTHLFVDEFQDTDPVQMEILEMLAEDDPGGKLFLVGDPKQSIYKFRRADLVLYRRVRERLEERGVGLVTLRRSFRSVPNLQQFINIAFETEMSGDVEHGHAEWAALERHREEIPDRPSVIALPVPRPYKTRLAKEAVAKSLPDAIAAFVDWLVRESGWGYKERDIAVLFRKRNWGKVDLQREVVRALEARSLPHLVAGSKTFHKREEVETLRAALTAIEWPDDELNVFAALKGSLFAIADEKLLLFRQEHGRLNPLRKEPTAFAEIDEVLGLLGKLHRGRNYKPFAAIVNELIEAARAHAGFLLRPGGQQILANITRVADLARTFEATGGVSFRGFVEDLTAQAERGEAAEAPVLEEDSDGVRLMTLHSAKGLEFPVVILADLTTGLSRNDPEAYVSTETKLCAMELLGCAPKELLDHRDAEARKERAEGVRVAYVAATRARDVLVVPAVGDEAFPADGWLGPLNKALYPARANWRRARKAPGCPEGFGEASVVARPMDYDGQEEFSVRPGLVQPEVGEHEVVWWDTHKLKLGEEQNQTIWQDEVLKETLQPDGGASLAEYRAWQAEREGLLQEGARPEVAVFLASMAEEGPPATVPVEYASAAPEGRRALGKRFGVLVHAALRDVALDASALAVRRIVEMNARVLGATAEETRAAVESVEGALRHPVFGQARAAERCYREYPVTLKLDDGRMLEGVVDLAFASAGTWTIVDFKTDAETAGRREQYGRQLQWYAYALEKLTGMEARGVLLGV